MNYQYGNKRNWRRWMWNRIADRTEDRRNALVLFLAGEDAHDIAAAELKGFQRKNMIAVERDKATLQKLRDSGVLTIEGDLCDVLLSWPQTRSVDVVVADFCCGLEMSILQALHQAPMMRPLLNAAMAFNFLRGRDPSTNAIRSGLAGSGISTKNRAETFYGMCMAGCLRDMPNVDERLAEAGALFDRLAEPAFSSYRSTAGHQFFDTVVFKAPFQRLLNATSVPAPKAQRLEVPDRLKPQVRRTAAVLAHRTRRA